MQKPVFLSVGGESDAAFAAEIHALLGSQLCYHYKITGEENVAFRPEIESQLNGCRVFVVIWTADYLNSEHAKLELAYFRKVSADRPGADSCIVVVPRLEGQPDIQSQWKNPISSKVEFALGDSRLIRSVAAGADAGRCAEMIRRELARLAVIQDVLVSRGFLHDKLQAAITTPDYKSRELVLVSGLHGDGRRTAIRNFMHQTYAHLVERQVMIDSIDGPKDLLLQLMESVHMAAAKRAEVLGAIEAGQTTAIKEVRKILHLGREQKAYCVIVVDRFASADGPAVPEWFSDALGVFKDGDAPLVFLVGAGPMTEGMRSHYPNALTVHVPGLEDGEMLELTNRLSRHDPTKKLWSKEKIEKIAASCGSSPSLCKSVAHALYVEPNLDLVEKIAQRAEENFGAALAGLMAHWVRFYENRHSDLLALRVIEKLGVTSAAALDEILGPAVETYGAFDLYTLRAQGLVEQLADGLYRIPALIQRRLGDALWAKKNIDVTPYFDQFAKRVAVLTDEHGAVFAVNAITAALRSSTAELPSGFAAYLSVSMLLKTGLERYSNKDYKTAHRVLQRAFAKLKTQTEVIDASTKIEMLRYAGLAAARQGDASALSNVCQWLEGQFQGTKKANSALGMAHFVRGFDHRLKRQWKDAIYELEAARRAIQQDAHLGRQRAAICTELSIAYSRSQPPNYKKALDFALHAYTESDVTHTLSALLKVAIYEAFESGLYKTREELAPKTEKIEAWLEKLSIRCREQNSNFDASCSLLYGRLRAAWESQAAAGYGFDLVVGMAMAEIEEEAMMH